MCAMGWPVSCELYYKGTKSSKCVEGISNKGHASSNKCLTSSNKKLLRTSATLVVTGALLVVTRS